MVRPSKAESLIHRRHSPLPVLALTEFDATTVSFPLLDPLLSNPRLIRCFEYWTLAEYYQLEEMEDKDSCTTELYLRADGVIEFGDTDGPQFITAAGTWSVPPGTDDYNSEYTFIRSIVSMAARQVESYPYLVQW